MQSLTPPDLSWMPTSEQLLATPCGDEHMRNHVLLSTPRTPTTPKGLPSLWQNTPTAEAAQFQLLLRIQSEELMSWMDSLMLRQEATIKNLLMAHNGSSVPCDNSLSFSVCSGVERQDCMTKVEGNADQTQFGTKPAVSSDDEADAGSQVSNDHSASNLESGIPKQSSLKGFASHFTSQRDFTQMGKVNSNRNEGWLSTCCSGASHREIFGKMLSSRAHHMVMTAVVAANSMLIVADTDANAGCTADAYCGADWIWYVNVSFLLIYTAEGIMVIDTYRWKLLKEGSLLFEIFVVVCGFLDLLVVKLFGRALPNMQLLKLIRLTRIARGARLLNMFPELQIILHGFIVAMRAMLWSFLLLMLLLIFLAIISVELVHGVNKDVQQESQYCQEVFDSVWNASLFLFQILLAGDSWGACSLRIIHREPAAFLLFGASLVAVQVGFMNLIMSVIIERVADARAMNTQKRLRERDQGVDAHRRKWLKLFKELDADGSGELNMLEITNAFDKNPDFRDDLRLLGIEREDLPTLFLLMDEDANKLVNINELLSTLDMMWRFHDRLHQVTLSQKLRLAFQRLDDRLQGLESNVQESHQVLVKVPASGANSRSSLKSKPEAPLFGA